MAGIVCLVCRNCEQCWVCMVCWEFYKLCHESGICGLSYVEGCGTNSGEYHAPLEGFSLLCIVGKMAQDVGMV